jgi:hypothetical protein
VGEGSKDESREALGQSHELSRIEVALAQKVQRIFGPEKIIWFFTKFFLFQD